ncbi:MAG TPA: sulfite exporter TauE/SafE family protein [Chthonomonas sp.]|uniref:sulfite exporter TauE/SafE family protein n=1 Tax=Chthonomonas sp. TaxID=2282153 RepID=UPI002B4B78EF|nr:sulfite exporter TauE/SafE family protein [Chthonomonas sp.]HLI49164.1 sulfite exporter TauE/SafE family protein [Chthonomonas sp.]
MDFRYTVVGLLIGFIVGLTGTGAGSITTPMLIFLLGVEPKIAIGTDLAYATLSRLAGVGVFWRKGQVNLHLVKRLAVGSVPGALVGIWGLWALHHYRLVSAEAVRHLTLHLLGATLLLSSGLIALKAHPRFAEWRLPLALGKPRRTAWIAIPVGFVFGMMVGVTSVGGGALFGPVLLLVFGLGATTTIGTETAHAVLLTGVAALSNVVLKGIDYAMLGSLLLGSIPGELLGSYLCVKTAERPMRLVLAVVLLLSGLKAVVA